MKITEGSELVEKILLLSKHRGLSLFLQNNELISILIFLLMIYFGFSTKAPKDFYAFAILLSGAIFWITSYEKSKYLDMNKFLENAQCQMSDWINEIAESKYNGNHLAINFFVPYQYRDNYEKCSEKLEALVKVAIPTPDFLWLNAFILSDKISIVEDLEKLLEKQTKDINIRDKLDSEKLKHLLSNTEIEEVFKILLSINEKESLRNDIFILKHNYSKYQRHSIIGTIGFEQFMVEQSKIVKQLLDFIDIISNQPK